MVWHEKRWQFLAVAGDRGIVAAAVAHLGYLGLGFAYAYDRQSGKQRRFEVMVPLGLGAVVAREPGEGLSRLSVPTGLIQLTDSRLEIRAHAFQAEFTLAPAAPFDASWRIATAGDHRTRKRMGGRGHGTVTWDDGPAMPLTGGVLSDWSRGELARETRWRWAAGTGKAGGRSVAFNLRTGFDDPSQAENVIWLDGMPEPLGPAELEPGTPWRIRCGALALEFHPDGEQREDVNLGLVMSRYTQPWGRFTGTWGGLPLEGYGVTEDHHAR